MVVSLLELSGDSASLEFEDDDIGDVFSVIDARFGTIQIIKEGPDYDEIECGGEAFIYYFEWTPCIIARSSRGKEMLRLAAGLLAQRTA